MTIKGYSFLELIPVPIAGLMLALATTGNTIKPRSEILRYIFGLVAMAIFLLLLSKTIRYFEYTKDDFYNVVIASVMPTFSMGGMVISTYILPINYAFASILWYLCVALHIFFICAFTIMHLVKYKKGSIIPSWYIVYVGIVVATVTGKAFNPFIGKLSFYFGFISYLVLIPFVVKKVYVDKDMKEPIKPLKAIMAAPGSLCLAGYISGIKDKNSAMIMLLVALSQIFYVVVLAELPRILKIKFYPSLSAITFPLAISGLSMRMYNKYLVTIGNPSSIINVVSTVEEAISVVICLYVLYKYTVFLKVKFNESRL